MATKYKTMSAKLETTLNKAIARRAANTVAMQSCWHLEDEDETVANYGKYATSDDDYAAEAPGALDD